MKYSLDENPEKGCSMEQRGSVGFDLAPTPLLVVGIDGVVYAVNEAFHSMELGGSIGSEIGDFCPALAALPQQMAAAGTVQGSAVLEVVGTLADGREIVARARPASATEFVLQFTVLGCEIDTIGRTGYELPASARVMFEAAGAAMCIVDAGMMVRHVNSEFLELSGYSREEAVGHMTKLDFLQPCDVSLAGSYHERRLLGGEEGVPRSVEYVAVRKDGTHVDIRVGSHKLPGTDWTAHTIFDITGYRESEREIKRREKNYRALFETTGAATILCEEDMLIALANEEFIKMCGYEKEELEGNMRALDFIHPEDLPLVVSHMSRRRSGDTSVPNSYEFRGISKEGRIVHVWMVVGLVPGSKRSINSLVDITHLKNVEDALKHRVELEEFLNRVTTNFIGVAPEDFEEQMNIVLEEIAMHYEGERVQILEFRNDDTLLRCTHEWCAEGIRPSILELGFISVEPLQAWLDAARDVRTHVVQVDELGIEEAAQANFLKRYDVQSLLVVPLLVDDGCFGVIRVDAVSGPIIWSEQDVQVLETTAKVISTAKKSVDAVLKQQVIEEQMRQAQRLESLGVLAGGIAHDFNNILTAILGYCDLAMVDNDDPEDVQECLHEISESAERAKELVRHILTFSRKSPVRRVPLSWRRVVENALGMFRACVPATISIDFQVRGSTTTVSGDPVQLYQVVMNLCTNAFHAMGNGGTLGLRLQTRMIKDGESWGHHPVVPGAYVEFVVSDTGCGMRPDVLERIFDPFYTTKDLGEGTGMGLSMVHGIVNDHHGVMYAESKVGLGSTFHIMLPLCKEAPVEGDSDSHGALPMAPAMPQKQIMVVDDELKIRNLQERLLRQIGYEVTLFKDAIEALAAFEKRPTSYDLIISDWAMPEMNGAEFAGQVKRIREDIPIILCTGFSEMVLNENRQMEIFDILAKPFVKEDLASLVEKALRFAD